MSKPLLDALGTQQVLSALYQLNEPQLALECHEIESDLGTWLEKHFSLTLRQENYLSAMDEHYTEVLAQKISYFVSQRLPVQLVTASHSCDDEDCPDIDHPGKLILTCESTNTTYVPGKGYTTTESLEITFAEFPTSN